VNIDLAEGRNLVITKTDWEPSTGTWASLSF